MSRQLIAIDSSPGNGNIDLADHIIELAKNLGFLVDSQEDVLNGISQKNIILRHPDSPPGEELLLLAHLDTPDPGSYGFWTETLSNPFKATVHGDKLFGLGTANAKVDFLCKMLAAEKLLNKKIKRPFAVVGTYGEQSGMVGALKLIRKKMVNPKFAIVGEATKMQLVTSCAGITMVEVTIPFSESELEYHLKSNLAEGVLTQSKVFRGKAGLGLTPQLSDNAIVKMFDYISNLEEGIVILNMDGGVSPNTTPATAFLEVDLVGGFENKVAKKITKILEGLNRLESDFQKFPCDGFDSKYCTINIGKIRTFKDHIKVEGSCRILPSVDEVTAESWMQELRKICDEVGARFQVTLNRRPFVTSPESQSVALCLDAMNECQIDPVTHKTLTCTEANILSRLGVESLVIGPGQGPGNTHQPNEFIEIKEADKAIDLYETLLRKYCL